MKVIITELDRARVLGMDEDWRQFLKKEKVAQPKRTLILLCRCVREPRLHRYRKQLCIPHTEQSPTQSGATV